MPRTKEQLSEVKDERRASILSAALPLFSLSNKVSIDAICEKAKCSHGIIYHYYRNTDQIYEKLMKSPTNLKLKQDLFEFDGGSTYEKIEKVIGTLLDVSKNKIENICYLNLYIKETGKNSLHVLLEKLIRDGQIAGSIVGGEPSEIVDSIFLLFKGLYLSFLLEKHPVIKVPSLETVMQLLRKPTNFSRQIL